jgi:hypothetical protein
MKSAELRARIRDLMASGVLPRVLPPTGLPNAAPVAAPSEIDLGAGAGASCLVCGEPGPQVTYPYPGGLLIRFHLSCDRLWQQERDPQ